MTMNELTAHEKDMLILAYRAEAADRQKQLDDEQARKANLERAQKEGQ